MARDPLPVLLRLRRLAVDEARRDVAACLNAEAAAARARSGAETAIAREIAAAALPAGNDPARRAFAAWLPAALLRRDGARAESGQAEARTRQAQAVLASAETALRAVEDRLALHDVERRAGEARTEQQHLDEVAGRRARDRMRRSL